MGIWLKEDSEGINIKVRVNPRSSRNVILGLLDDTLVIKLTAPPLRNKANKLLLEFLSKTFNVKKKILRLFQGKSPEKK